MTTNPNQLRDQQIDRVLTALRNIELPGGLEARVTARLAQAEEAHTLTTQRSGRSPLFAAVRSFAIPHTLLVETPLYAIAAAALIAASFFAFHHKHNPTTTANTKPIPATVSTPAASDLRAEGPSHHSVGQSPTYSRTTIGGPTARPIAPLNIVTNPSVVPPTDPDSIALAETLAPSRPAPPMPLTPQEQLLVAATRQGQPIEVAELDALRQPALRALSEAREHSTIHRYVESLLGPLAAAEAIHPTPSSTSDNTADPPSSK